MRKSHFAETQIIGMIKAQEAGLTVAEDCRKHGISPASFYKLKAKYGGMEVWDARRLKQLEEVEPLRRHWFEPNGEGQAKAVGRGHHAGCGGAERPSGKALTTLSQRREAAFRAMRGNKISQRRACDLVDVDPKTVRREEPQDHADIRKEMHVTAGNRRRFGYRRIVVMLERKGFTMNEKKLYRL